jgi:membrane protease YdiL (CAAX protease family)
VVLSSVIFSLGHGYEGSAGVVTVGFMGLAFAIVYVWRRSLVAPIIMHFLQDFLALIVIPVLHHKGWALEIFIRIPGQKGTAADRVGAAAAWPDAPESAS